MSGPEGAFPKAPRHVLASSSVYDGEYIRHYTGVSPVLLSCGLDDAIGPDISWAGSHSAILWNSYHDLPPELTRLLPASKAPWTGEALDFVRMKVEGGLDVRTTGGKKVELASHRTRAAPPAMEGKKRTSIRYELSDLAEFKAVVVLPYSITNSKLVEQYAMNMPIFVPSPALGLPFVNDRTTVYDPWCLGYCPGCPWMTDAEMPAPHSSSPYEFSPNARPEYDGPAAEDDGIFWLGFSEVYLWPCVQQFDSWEELISLLETADLDEMSHCTAQARKWRRFERAQNWCWAMGCVGSRRDAPQGGSRDYHYLYTEGYENALIDLYNTTDILELWTR